MTLLSLPGRNDRPAPVSRADWVAAGLDVLLEKGVAAVQITLLARRLKVTRGGFYWHFEGREALLDALLAEWRARNTGVMLDAVEAADSLEAGVLSLFSVWVDHTRFDPALDQAVRDWGRRAPSVETLVRAEDDARVVAIAVFFRRMGYPATEAFIRARVIYFTQLSYYSTGVEEPMAARLGYLEAYFESFTGRSISDEAAAAFRANLGQAAP
ncbi:MAG: TetR/AcrR family transcriptional regulator [Pseudomonadota bacterium]